MGGFANECGQRDNLIFRAKCAVIGQVDHLERVMAPQVFVAEFGEILKCDDGAQASPIIYIQAQLPPIARGLVMVPGTWLILAVTHG